MSEVIVQVTNLVKENKGQRILDDVSISLGANLVHCIVGENGAGKSTLLKALIGVESTDSGTCQVMGYNSEALPTKVRAKIGYISSDHSLPNHLTIKQLIEFQRSSFSHWSRDIFNEITSEVSISLDKRSDQLSLGENLIVYLALVLAQKPELLILDEPTNGLDVHSQQLLFDALLLNDYFEHSTVLFSTHRVSEIERFADNIVVLHQGKLVTTGTAQSIMNNVQSWRFNVSSLDLITQSIKGICSIKQVDDTTYLTNLSSSNLTKDKLNALGRPT